MPQIALPLVAESDLHLFAQFLYNELVSVDRARQAFARGEHTMALTPDTFRQHMSAIGMSTESIDRVIEEIWQ